MEIKNPKKYDLEERTHNFAKSVREFVLRIPKNVCNNEDSKQVVRSSGSIGANYIEANDSLGKKDFLMRIKIATKEAKETIYWLKLLDVGLFKDKESERNKLVSEGTELLYILSSIYRKSKT